jgi:hypothetical protein
VPYLEAVRKKKGLSRMVGLLIIDCWSVHRGEEFRVWMRTSFGWLRIVFVPGGCKAYFHISRQLLIKNRYGKDAAK